MNIGILGSGSVGLTIGAKLVELGHQVAIGTRDTSAPKIQEWLAKTGSNGKVGAYSDAAAFGDLLFNCLQGASSIAGLMSAGEANLNGKTLIDISNPLDFSKGMPPTLFVSNDDSLGEQIQRAFPDAKVVKTLNTVTTNLMVDASLVPGNHSLFICGNDPEAVEKVIDLLKSWFGWQSIINLGDITNARATESILPIWIRLMMKLGTPYFNFQINVK